MKNNMIKVWKYYHDYQDSLTKKSAAPSWINPNHIVEINIVDDIYSVYMEEGSRFSCYSPELTKFLGASNEE